MSEDNYQLNDRKKQILQAIIDAHIKGGEPVGSKYLTEEANIPFSSATIRNDMADLEEMGLLVSPHHSSGRVPSEKGYKYYVQSLMQRYQMTLDDIDKLNRLTRQKMSELDRIIDAAGMLMSSLTNYTAMTFKGASSDILILSFRTMYMSSRMFLLIMVNNRDKAETRHINTDFDIDEQILLKLEKVLNKYVAGVSAQNITLPMIVEMEREMGEDGAPLINQAIKCIYELEEISGGNLKFDGVNKLLQYPEYSDPDKIRGILGMIEEHKEEIIDVVSKANPDETAVVIGSDMQSEAAKNSSLIFRPIKIGGKVVGAIGLIGPTRMDYSKVISTVDYVTESIEKMMGIPSLPENTDKGDN